jgi:arylformamidase
MDAVKEYEDHIASVCALDTNELTILYSPSAWVKRMSTETVIDDHCDHVSQASIKARAELVCSCGVGYGPSLAQKFDIVRGKLTEEDAPIFVYIHGGYWQAMSVDWSLFMAIPLVEAGAKVVAVGYDLAPKVTVDVIVEQIKEAIVQIVQMAVKTNSRGVYLAGHSAGAHLVVRVLDSNLKKMLSDVISEDAASMIKGAFLISGIYDLRPLVFTTENEILHMTEESAWHLSPMNPIYIQQLTLLWRHVRLIVIIGENDSPEFRFQSKYYSNFLQASGSSTKLIDMPDVDHFNMPEQLEDPNYILTKELLDLMQLKNLNEPTKSTGATRQGSSHT